MVYNDFSFTVKDSVGIMTLNRPDKLNALNAGITHGILSVTKDMQENTDVRALVLRGEGRAFCAGGDVTGFPVGDENREKREDGVANRKPASEGSTPLALRNCPKLIVGALHGYAVGGGLSIALATDIRIAAEGTKFAPIQIRRGILPDMGLTHLLSRIVGAQKAFEIIVRAANGGFVEAEEALDLGLISKIVPMNKLHEETMELAHSIASGPSLAYKFAKIGIYSALENDLEYSSNFEGPMISQCFASKDCEESVKAFIEKRTPVFIGR
jgi:enoyl-CoA hydratase/carnithine racemase